MNKAKSPKLKLCRTRIKQEQSLEMFKGLKEVSFHQEEVPQKKKSRGKSNLLGSERDYTKIETRSSHNIIKNSQRAILTQKKRPFERLWRNPKAQNFYWDRLTLYSKYWPDHDSKPKPIQYKHKTKFFLPFYPFLGENTRDSRVCQEIRPTWLWPEELIMK